MKKFLNKQRDNNEYTIFGEKQSTEHLNSCKHSISLCRPRERKSHCIERSHCREKNMKKILFKQLRLNILLPIKIMIPPKKKPTNEWMSSKECVMCHWMIKMSMFILYSTNGARRLVFIVCMRAYNCFSFCYSSITIFLKKCILCWLRLDST